MALPSIVKRSFTHIALLAMVISASGIAADLPKGLSAPPKPTEMPAFELPTTAGGKLRSDSLRGQVVIVRYWASW